VTNNEYIEKAVSLADGWRINKMGNIQAPCVHRSSIDRPLKPVLDALAAQLVRQSTFKPQYRDDPLDTIKEIIDNDWIE